MGLLTKLTTDGSNLSINDGLTPAINPLTLKTSTLHSNEDPNQSYSLNGSNVSIVGNQLAQYEDGIVNPLPLPSSLDLNGVTPLQYLNNLPEGGTLINNNATPFG